MKLKGYRKIEGVIEVVTGLHVGGSSSVMEIGGNDNPVIKNPVTKEPYIPGSSIKGKMRSLLEWKLGKVNTTSGKGYGEVHKCGNKKCPVCVIFGSSADEAGLGPSRLIVRDAFLDPGYRKEMEEETAKKGSVWTPMDLMEDKYENSINRITARANPRPLERVVPGARFRFSMSYRVFENGDGGGVDEELFFCVLDGLRLIEADALGGAGSRGCGQVRFLIDTGNGQLKELKDVTPAHFPTAEQV